jgi:hypothetical protein
MSAIQISAVIGKNEDGSDITQDVDVPPPDQDGLTLSDLRKSLIEGTLETIMWVKWGSSSISLGRGDLHITHPELCD